MSRNVVYFWAKQGPLPASRLVPGWPWRIQLDPGTEEDLRESIARSSRMKKPADPKSSR